VAALVAALLAGVAIAAWRIPSVDIPFVSEDDQGAKGHEPFQPRHLCTLIGCPNPAVSVATRDDVDASFPGAHRMLVCVDERCSLSTLTQDHRGNVVSVPISYRQIRRVRVEVQIQTREGEVLDRQVAHGMLHHEFPNGRSCGPECISLLFAYDPVRGELSASPAALRRQHLGRQYGTTR
jgi:hypothetical protein